jgi:hypothetical protein
MVVLQTLVALVVAAAALAALVQMAEPEAVQATPLAA